ncbi:hypothetical protein F511_29855 [Dorcoceras hygrometricum]|uniref:Uncharacterized protein n=1 Tax=Dorcoceras hygrometricum TaxID=472368 RepID=A0A2Z7BCA2_9LAMI|nr:hypothetical protein F511_29855 [Dorcoceras hygrometricum]
MATTFPPIRSPVTCSSKPDPNLSSSSNNKWWMTIFGWSTQPDYISTRSSDAKERSLRGRFTADKARELRRKTAETSSFHDAMYHSAIASRLASDLSERDDS